MGTNERRRMKRNPNLKEKYLDGEVLFRKYFEMGEAKSIKRLARWAISVGMAKPTKVSKNNPEGIPTMGVWKSMWRWASLKENRDTAWEIYKKYNSKKSFAEWVEYMKDNIHTAWQHSTEAKYNKFLKDNGWT